jgi:hypothetical protein
MKKNIFTTIIIIGFSIQGLFAHGDHHGLTKEDVLTITLQHIDELVSEKKLPESWKNAKALPGTIVSKTISDKKRWAIVFTNEKETNPDKQKIEFILTPSGKYVSHQFVK